MPLEIILILVATGIAGIALLLHLLGHSARAPLTEEDARAAWARHAPDSPARAVDLSADAMAALIETDRGPALVWRIGADSTGHWLSRARTRQTSTGLRVMLGDFAAPSVRVALTAERAAAWDAAIAEARAPRAQAEGRTA